MLLTFYRDGLNIDTGSDEWLFRQADNGAEYPVPQWLVDTLIRTVECKLGGQQELFLACVRIHLEDASRFGIYAGDVVEITARDVFHILERYQERVTR